MRQSPFGKPYRRFDTRQNRRLNAGKRKKLPLTGEKGQVAPLTEKKPGLTEREWAVYAEKAYFRCDE